MPNNAQKVTPNNSQSDIFFDPTYSRAACPNCLSHGSTFQRLKFSEIQRLKDAPAFAIHLAVGDSLLHGPVPGTVMDRAALRAPVCLETLLRKCRKFVVVPSSSPRTDQE